MGRKGDVCNAHMMESEQQAGATLMCHEKQTHQSKRRNWETLEDAGIWRAHVKTSKILLFFEPYEVDISYGSLCEFRYLFLFALHQPLRLQRRQPRH